MNLSKYRSKIEAIIEQSEMDIALKLKSLLDPFILEQLCRDNLIMLEALEFYSISGNYAAGPSSWSDRSKPISNGIHTSDLYCPVLNDDGLKAREVLKQITKE